MWRNLEYLGSIKKGLDHPHASLMPSTYLPIVVVLLALLWSSDVTAQTALQGVLLAPDGEPHAGELVALESGLVGPGIIDSTRTDDRGQFHLTLPEPVTYALGVWAGGNSFWFPLAAGEATGHDTLTVEVRRLAGRTLDGFAVASDVSVVADLANLYAAAERRHRSPPTSPELEAFATEADRITDAAPIERKVAVRDSLRAVGEALYEPLAVRVVEAFLAPLERETRPIMREGYALWAFDKVHKDSTRAALLVETVPPQSSLWAFEGNSAVGVSNPLGYAAEDLGVWGGRGPVEAFGDYVRALAYEHLDPNVRRQASRRFHELAVASGDEEGARAAFDQLAREFPGSEEVEAIQRSWSDTRALRPGQSFPSFSFRALQDSSAAVSTADVAGTTYLVDFWGSWCAPCVEELPALHALYEEYESRGFEIVSVATYDTPSDVTTLQDRGYPMPWLHAIVPEDEMEAARARFEFTGIPAAILVGPDGVILAEGQGARGEALAAALRDHFDAR